MCRAAVLLTYSSSCLAAWSVEVIQKPLHRNPAIREAPDGDVIVAQRNSPLLSLAEGESGGNRCYPRYALLIIGRRSPARTLRASDGRCL